MPSGKIACERVKCADLLIIGPGSMQIISNMCSIQASINLSLGSVALYSLNSLNLDKSWKFSLASFAGFMSS